LMMKSGQTMDDLSIYRAKNKSFIRMRK